MALALNILGTAVAFLVGALAANFYFVIVRRKRRGGYSVILPPSCPCCGRTERRIWMLPVIWYLLLGGRCGSCGYRYSKNLVYLEAGGGAVSALLYYYYGFSVPYVVTFAFAFLFLLNYVVEFRYAVLVPQLYWPSLALGAALSFAPGDPSPLSATLGAVLGGGPLWVFRRIRQTAHAETKALGRQLALVSLVGVFLGWPAVLFILAAGGAAAWVVPKVLPKTARPVPYTVFGITVLAATAVMAFYYLDLTAWYLKVR